MSLFGLELSNEIIVSIIVVNVILLVTAIIGFTNLKRQIKELKAIIDQIKEKQKELRK
jgi:hypothetical protein